MCRLEQTNAKYMGVATTEKHNIQSTRMKECLASKCDPVKNSEATDIRIRRHKRFEMLNSRQFFFSYSTQPTHRHTLTHNRAHSRVSEMLPSRKSWRVCACMCRNW